MDLPFTKQDKNFTRPLMKSLIVYLCRRRWTLLLMSLLIPLGFYTKVYGGPASLWVQNSLGGVLYVLFFSLVFSILFPAARPWKIALLVFLGTCSLECLQLWHPPFLESLRSTFIGAALLGNSFSWSDLLHYAAAGLLSLGTLDLFYKSEIQTNR
jgi:hypothetical protein